jgi:hypothetical protein
MFSVPIFGGSYEEDFDIKVGPMERERRFHHPEHMRNFAYNDLNRTIGMIFDIGDKLQSHTLENLFSSEVLEKYNIPNSRWRKFNGSNLFVFRKGDILI